MSVDLTMINSEWGSGPRRTSETTSCSSGTVWMGASLWTTYVVSAHVGDPNPREEAEIRGLGYAGTAGVDRECSRRVAAFRPIILERICILTHRLEIYPTPFLTLPLSFSCSLRSRSHARRPGREESGAKCVQ